MTDILMPALTDQMQEGTIVAWLAADGQVVAAGDEIVEIETDKATMSYPAEADGVLQIVTAVGDTVAVGAVIARVGVPAAGEAQTSAPEPEPVQRVEPEDDQTPTTAAHPEAAMAAAGAAPGSNGGRAASRVVTPVARRIAHAHGVTLQDVDGSGPHGRITKSDVLRAAGIELPPELVAPSRASGPAPTTGSPGAATATRPGSRMLRPTRLQQVVAKRMADATATIPHFQVQTEVRVDDAVALRGQLKAVTDGEPAPSINDLIVKACALVLPKHPLVNGSFKDGAYELHDHVHVGIAVASDDGLVVATVRDADIKSLGRIGRESRELAERVRAGTATPTDLTGATFSVSNLGMFGMTAITAVINPPQAAILGVGAARPTLARDKDGEVVDQQLLTLTLSCDHRILNGADGSRFLLDVKHTLEAPMRLAL